MRIPIKSARLTKLGGSFALIVPKHYIDNGIVDSNKFYDWTLETTEVIEDVIGGDAT